MRRSRKAHGETLRRRARFVGATEPTQGEHARRFALFDQRAGCVALLVLSEQSQRAIGMTSLELALRFL